MKMEDSSSALIDMDWAMKFLQLKYRERQFDWYGKRGLSWHISTVISFNASAGSLQLKSYAHLFDSCQQDWFAVCSIIENLLKAIKAENLEIESVYLRSDEAGCYHNNSLTLQLQILESELASVSYGTPILSHNMVKMSATVLCVP